jgi:hypothetical protein
MLPNTFVKSCIEELHLKISIDSNSRLSINFHSRRNYGYRWDITSILQPKYRYNSLCNDTTVVTNVNVGCDVRLGFTQTPYREDEP